MQEAKVGVVALGAQPGVGSSSCGLTSVAERNATPSEEADMPAAADRADFTALRDFRVVDVSTLIAGAYCSKLFADRVPR